MRRSQRCHDTLDGVGGSQRQQRFQHQVDWLLAVLEHDVLRVRTFVRRHAQKLVDVLHLVRRCKLAAPQLVERHPELGGQLLCLLAHVQAVQHEHGVDQAPAYQPRFGKFRRRSFQRRLRREQFALLRYAVFPEPSRFHNSGVAVALGRNDGSEEIGRVL
ncbi:hypothetical protein, putative [Babesia ovata]|uniref:Uncharacterized protein n=1 Tax=Babesia ovata TaxID=189622 RepID=A0A2H6KAW7_9APIC|nr:hypothetical protein, putative [Babesia ovata]GBE60126.1 hypothetical protein, putative [Babesia ovata]